MFIIFCVDVGEAIKFAEDKLMKEGKETQFFFSNDFKRDNVDKLIEQYPEATTIFITKGTEPGGDGVWDAHYIIDDKEDIKQWKNMLTRS